MSKSKRMTSKGLANSPLAGRVVDTVKPVDLMGVKVPIGDFINKKHAGQMEFLDRQIIHGTCPSKSNCYRIMTVRGKTGLVKTPSMKAYEESFYIQCDKYRNANIAGYFELHMSVYYPNQRSDLDNSLKVVLDCLQRVKAISNDNKATKLVIEKFLDKERPRIEFVIVKA